MPTSLLIDRVNALTDEERRWALYYLTLFTSDERTDRALEFGKTNAAKQTGPTAVAS